MGHLNMILKVPVGNQTHQHKEMTLTFLPKVTSCHYFSVQHIGTAQKIKLSIKSSSVNVKCELKMPQKH